jgi:hypothetical protein
MRGFPAEMWDDREMIVRRFYITGHPAGSHPVAGLFPGRD